MSQYNSSMFSDAVYLFGTTFASPSRGGFFKYVFGHLEELPDGTMVDQKELAEQAVLAAFAYLYYKKLIDIDLVVSESRFWKNIKMTAIVKKLQSSPLDTSGLEAAIFAHVQNNVSIYDITRDVLRNGSNPWGDMLQIVKKDLLHRGILKQVATYTYVYVVHGDISKEEKQVTELKKTLKELQSKGVFDGILSAIADGMSSRENTGHG